MDNSATSPMRCARQRELLASLSGGTATAAAEAICAVTAAATQKARKAHGGVDGAALEAWANSVLAAQQQQLPQGVTGETAAAAAPGLARFGLARGELVTGAGLRNETVDRLYRSLYVYSLGIFDTMQDITRHTPKREQLLQNVWNAFLVIAEATLAGAFSNQYLDLAATSQAAMAELAVTRDALFEARQDADTLAKDMAWMSAQSAEDAALRQAARAQLAQAQAQLAQEASAREHAVGQYCQAVEDRSRMALQLAERSAQLSAAQSEHADLLARCRSLQQHYSALLGQCRAVRNLCQHADAAISQAPGLSAQLDALQPPQVAAAVLGAPAPGSSSLQGAAGMPEAGAAACDDGPVDTAEDMQPLVARLVAGSQLMFGEWRAALDAAAASGTEMAQATGELQQAQADRAQQAEHNGSLQASLTEAQRQLQVSHAECSNLRQEVARLSELAQASAMDEQAAQCERDAALRKAQQLHKRCSDMNESLGLFKRDALAQKDAEAKLVGQLGAGAARLQRKHMQLKAVGAGMALGLQSTWDLQIARRVLLRQLHQERSTTAGLAATVKARDESVQGLEGQLAQQRAVSDGLREALDTVRGQLLVSKEEGGGLASQVAAANEQVVQLKGRLSGVMVQLQDATQQLASKSGALETAMSALGALRNENKELKESLLKAQQALHAADLEHKLLQGDIARADRQRAELEAAGEQQRTRLRAEVERWREECAQSERRAELATLDVAAERDKVEALQQLLTHKRMKKGRWKEACGEAEQQAVALHQRLLAKQASVQQLQERVGCLALELQLLSAAQQQRVRLHEAAAADGSAAAVAGGDGSAEAVVAGDGSASGAGSWQEVEIEEAQLQLDAAAVELAAAAGALLVAEGEVEAAEDRKGQLLLALAAPDLSPEALSAANSKVAEQAQRVTALRKCRSEAEAAQAQAAASVRGLEQGLRDALERVMDQRQALMEQNTMKAEHLSGAAALAQVQEAHAARQAMQARLAEQLTLFEGMQRERDTARARACELQGAVESLIQRMQGAQADSMALEASRGEAHSRVAAMQGEMAQLRVECAKSKGIADAAEEHAAAAERRVEEEKKATAASLARIEAKHQADRSLIDASSQAEKQRCQAQVGLVEGKLRTVQARCGQLQAAFEAMVAGSLPMRSTLGYARYATCWAPQHASTGRWVFAFEASTHWGLAAGMLSALQSDRDLASSGCRPPSVHIPAPAGIKGLNLSSPELLGPLLGELLLAKVAADAAADAQCARVPAAGSGCSATGIGARPSLEAVVYTFFLERLGSRVPAEAHCNALAVALFKQQHTSKRAQLVGRMLGLFDPMHPAVMQGVVALLAQLHASFGPLQDEDAHGCGQVPCAVAAQAAIALLQQPFAQQVPEATALPAALAQAATGGSASNVGVDAVLEAAAVALAAQRDADRAALVHSYRSDARVNLHGGLYSQADMQALLQHVAAPLPSLPPAPAAAAAAAPAIDVGALFVCALARSGQDAAMVTAEGFANALLDAGVVGPRPHLARHPPISQPPVFDGFRLLEASWAAVRPDLLELLTSLPRRQPALVAEAGDCTAAARKLDELIRSHGSTAVEELYADEEGADATNTPRGSGGGHDGAAPAGGGPSEAAWRLYRQLMAFFSRHGSFVDAGVLLAAAPKAQQAEHP